MKTSHFSITDVGLKRKNNEDAVLVDERLGLFILCDGMGGHNAGETASKLATSGIQKFFEEYEHAPEEEINALQEFPRELPLAAKKLVYSIIRANTLVTETAAISAGYQGMGTTVVALLRAGRDFYAAHVGDSRIYLVRGGAITRVTEDHSVFYEELKRGMLSRESLEHLPFKNRLTRALGHMDKAKVDMKVLAPHSGDVFLLCSDGITDMMEDDEILEIVRLRSADLVACGNALVDGAKRHGGVDNISAILVRVDAA